MAGNRVTLIRADKQNREYKIFFPSFSFCFIEDIEYKDTIFRNIYSVIARIELLFDIPITLLCKVQQSSEIRGEKKKNEVT